LDNSSISRMHGIHSSWFAFFVCLERHYYNSHNNGPSAHPCPEHGSTWPASQLQGIKDLLLFPIFRLVKHFGFLQDISHSLLRERGMYNIMSEVFPSPSHPRVEFPVPKIIDNMARLKHIVNTTLMHRRESEQVIPTAVPMELRIEFRQTV